MILEVNDYIHPLLRPKIDRAVSQSITLPSRKCIIGESALIDRLVKAGIWDTLGWFRIIANSSSNAYGLIDLIRPSDYGTTFSTQPPDFSANHGVKTGPLFSQDTVVYLGVNQSALNTNGKYNGANDYVFLKTLENSTTGIDMGMTSAGKRYLLNISATTISGEPMTGSSPSQTVVTPISSAIGFAFSKKTSLTTIESYMENVLTSTATCTNPNSHGNTTNQFVLGACNVMGTVSNFAANTYTVAGGGIGTIDHALLRQYCNDYHTFIN